MLTSIGLGRRIDSPLTTTTTPQHQPIVIHSIKHPKRMSSSSIVDDSEQTEFVNISSRSRPCYSPARPNSLVLSTTQNSSQITDDDNEKYYSAQSSKLSTPMVHSMNYMKNSDEKLILSSILDIDSEEQKTHQTKVLPPKNENKNFHISHHVLEKDFLR